MKEISKQDLLRKAKFRGVLGAVILLGIGVSGTVGVSDIDEDAVAIFRVLALLATLAIFYDCFVCLEKALGVRFVKTYRLIESIPIVAILCYCAMVVALKEGAMLGLLYTLLYVLSTCAAVIIWGVLNCRLATLSGVDLFKIYGIVVSVAWLCEAVSGALAKIGVILALPYLIAASLVTAFSGILLIIAWIKFNPARLCGAENSSELDGAKLGADGEKPSIYSKLAAFKKSDADDAKKPASKARADTAKMPASKVSADDTTAAKRPGNPGFKF